MSDKQHKPGRDWGPLTYAVVGFLGLVGVWALDTFTVQGLLTAVWPWTDTTGMLWPWATRIVWWVIFWQVAVAVEMRCVWREARLEVSSRWQLWLAAHVSLVHRLIRRGRHHWAAIPNARVQAKRPLAVTATSSVSGPVSRTVQDTPATPKAA